MLHIGASLRMMSQPAAYLIGWCQVPPAVCNQEHLGVRITWHPEGTRAHRYTQCSVSLTWQPFPQARQDHLQMCRPCSHLRTKTGGGVLNGLWGRGWKKESNSRDGPLHHWWGFPSKTNIWGLNLNAYFRDPLWNDCDFTAPLWFISLKVTDAQTY